jgi:hypothetical protein
MQEIIMLWAIQNQDSSPKDEHNLELELESAENDEISDIINMYSY